MGNYHTLILADGTRLDDLIINGTNYISRAPLRERDIAGKLAHIIDVAPDGTRTEMHDMAIARLTESGGEWWLALRSVPPAEAALARNRSDIDYLAMMAGVDLWGV